MRSPQASRRTPSKASSTAVFAAPLAALALVGSGLAFATPASADPGTVYSLQSSACPTNIVYGQNSWCVDTLQTVLQQLGFTLSADGQFGPATEAAVKWVQTKGHLQNSSVSVDGQVGPVTKSWLVTLIEGQTKSLDHDTCGLFLETHPDSGAGTTQAIISESPADGSYCEGALFRSTDGGHNWTQVSGDHLQSPGTSTTTYAYADTATDLARVCGQGSGPGLVDSGCTVAF